MKPELIMLSADHGNKQCIIASDEEEFNNIQNKADFETAGRKKRTDRQYMGKRTYRQMQNLNRLEEDDDDLLTEYELKQGIQAKKRAYKKLADYMVRNEKLQDYYLQIDQDKTLLVSNFLIFRELILIE